LNLTREVVDIDEEEKGREDAALGGARVKEEGVGGFVGVNNIERAFSKKFINPCPQFALNTCME
jgi:hypothetical protein